MKDFCRCENPRNVYNNVCETCLMPLRKKTITPSPQPISEPVETSSRDKLNAYQRAIHGAWLSDYPGPTTSRSSWDKGFKAGYEAGAKENEELRKMNEEQRKYFDAWVDIKKENEELREALEWALFNITEGATATKVDDISKKFNLEAKA